jgi:hypothetical protein
MAQRFTTQLLKVTMHQQLPEDETTTEPLAMNALVASPVPRRRFLAAGVVAGMTALFSNVGPAFAATKKKAAPKSPVKKAATPATKLGAAPTVAPTATTAPAASADGSAAAASGATFSDQQELSISFSFVRTATGGRAHDPYVAVWIEDANEALVRTVSLNYQQGKGERWLNDLRRWYGAYTRNAAALGSDRAQEVTGPTRIPGTYALAWDGFNEAKVAVPHGNYYVCVEAAVEKGSYQLVREAIQLNGVAFTKAPADKGDLQKVKLELRARK